MINVLEQIIKLNMQQTSVNVLIKMTKQEKIQLVFQRAKRVIQIYKSKVQDLKAIGKIVGITEQPKQKEFLSPKKIADLSNRNKAIPFDYIKKPYFNDEDYIASGEPAINSGCLGLLNRSTFSINSEDNQSSLNNSLKVTSFEVGQDTMFGDFEKTTQEFQ